MPPPTSDPTRAPDSMTAFLARLDAREADLPKRLRQCATFARQNLHLIAISTVSQMAEAAGVAPSVFLRFCQAIGFSGYSEMQALFRNRVSDERPPYDRRLAELRHDHISGPSLLTEFSETGLRSLVNLQNSVSDEDVAQVVSGLAQARTIHLMGLRRAFAVAASMAYLLDKMQVPAILHNGLLGGISGRDVIRPQDAVFAISFAPFSPETIETAEQAAARGVAVYGMSDTLECPLRDIAKRLLIAREDEVGTLRAPIAAITLATTLCVAVGAERTGS